MNQTQDNDGARLYELLQGDIQQVMMNGAEGEL